MKGGGVLQRRYAANSAEEPVQAEPAFSTDELAEQGVAMAAYLMGSM